MKYVKINPAQPKVTVQFLEDKEPEVVQEASEESVTVQMTPFLFEVFTKFCWNTPCAPTDIDYEIMREAKIALKEVFGKTAFLNKDDGDKATEVFRKIIR